jgi:hypothetical protein
MRFLMWNVKRLFWASSLVTVSKKLCYKLHLVGVLEVRRDVAGTELGGEYTFSYRIGNENHKLGTGIFVDN